MTRKRSPAKKRRPLLAAFLSLAAPGLGQAYNGELVRGLVLELGLGLAAVLYALRAYTDGSGDPLFFLASTAIVLSFVVFSIVQAFLKARRLGAAYVLKRSNRLFIYLAFPVLALFVSIVPAKLVEDHALADISDWHPFRTAKAKEAYLRSYAAQEARLWPVAPETRVVATSWGRTFVRITGPADAPPLVLLHGANATSMMWAPNIKALSAVYRTYAPDNIYDMGRSVFTRRLKTPGDFASWLDGLFDALGLGDHIVLVGQSYGGWIAGQYLVRHPERLDKVVLLAPAATIEPFRTGFLGRGLLGQLPFRRFTLSMMDWLLGDLARSGEAGRGLIESYADHICLGQRCFKPKSLVPPTLLTDRELGNIKVPTLFMAGENEKIFDPAKALARLKRVAPQVRTELIPHAGHDLTLVRADLVDRKILDFLSESAERPRSLEK
ncbi:MAG TPA: alpha/beta hydrolase [Terriglobales bacterium]|nr:alpha/beta hydrolase [Terriglobales bacterium]